MNDIDNVEPIIGYQKLLFAHVRIGEGKGRYPYAVIAVISPYHLTRRDPAAMAALLCARGVVTMLPTPREPGSARLAFATAGKVATFREFMKVWAWSEPLWVDGLISSSFDEDSPLDELVKVGKKVTTDVMLEAIRKFTPIDFYEDDERFIGALAADLLKGGADPGVSVAVAAAMDRFAARHGLTAVRGVANSVVEKQELLRSSAEGSVIIPIFVQASAERILHARTVLSDVLEDWWLADDTFYADPAVSENARLASVRAAIAAYAAAFESRRADIFEGCADDDVRAVEGAATATWLTFRADNSLRCSLHAMDELVRSGKHEHNITSASQPSNELGMPADPLDAAPVSAVMIRALGVSPTNANHSLNGSRRNAARM